MTYTIYKMVFFLANVSCKNMNQFLILYMLFFIYNFNVTNDMVGRENNHAFIGVGGTYFKNFKKKLLTFFLEVRRHTTVIDK